MKKKKLKTYEITIPAFTKEIDAENKKQALEIFEWQYDNAWQDMDFNQPTVKEITTKSKKDKAKLEKRYLYDSKEFYYELDPDLFYLTPDKKTVIIVRYPIIQEGEKPNEDAEEIEFQGETKNSGSVFITETHIETKEFLKISEKLEKFI